MDFNCTSGFGFRVSVMILTEGLKILFLILLDPTGSLTFTLLMSGLVTGSREKARVFET